MWTSYRRNARNYESSLVTKCIIVCFVALTASGCCGIREYQGPVSDLPAFVAFVCAELTRNTDMLDLAEHTEVSEGRVHILVDDSIRDLAQAELRSRGVVKERVIVHVSSTWPGSWRVKTASPVLKFFERIERNTVWFCCESRVCALDGTWAPTTLGGQTTTWFVTRDGVTFYRAFSDSR